MDELALKQKRSRWNAGFYLTLVSFAILIAYSHRMAPAFDTANFSAVAWHQQIVEWCVVLAGEGRLIGWILPNVFAGTFIVWSCFYLAAKKNFYWGLISAGALLSCYGFLQEVRTGSIEIIYLAGIMLGLIILSKLPVKFRKSAILLWLPIWAVFGWEDLGNTTKLYHSMIYYFPLVPLAVVLGLTQIWSVLAYKNPNWLQITMMSVFLLGIAPERVLFYSLPLVAWSVGYVLANVQQDRRLFKVGNIVLVGLKFVPLLGLILLGLTYFECKKTQPDYSMPLIIPILLMAVMFIAIRAAKDLKRNYIKIAIVGGAVITFATLTIMVWEPYKQYIYFADSTPSISETN